jgi:hypothetical protein
LKTIETYRFQAIKPFSSQASLSLSLSQALLSGLAFFGYEPETTTPCEDGIEEFLRAILERHWQQ